MNVRGRTKKLIAIIAAAAACIALAAAGTAAYFNAESRVENVITMGNVAMLLHEEKADGTSFPADGMIGVMPGMSADKVVYVENVGKGDFYLRVSVDETIVPAAGVTENLNCDSVTLDINIAAWTEKDGYYYYNKSVAPGEKTQPIFTKVTFDSNMGNSYMDSKVTIHVDAQAVQSRNNGDSPLLAAGW